MVVISLI